MALALIIDPGKSVAAVTVEVPAIGGSGIGEEHCACVVGLGYVGEEIHGCIVIYEEGLGVPGLRTDVVWSLHRIADEEDGLVEAYDIVVSFFGVEFNCEASGVASEIWEFFAEGYGAETEEEGSLFSYRVKEAGFGKV